ncbi:helix-turn-helix domain-containing protein [Aquibacillus koreensis]|uniref:Helix-turn-helix domain-containing protein n=1 Tax=Aquibacillus koreensis TaxID=279446 RepID=A0A9X3WHT4_9BACI|nr:helix-turn-helix domain-containing protein [Aquibacillus koreensis]MCT2537417.1 helix-turn-helix domain-containing protein [Aquibacillus koreensis]MDC3418863.1 helix-turn-helix domain-containing protein [Aquibacillus koreensis]
MFSLIILDCLMKLRKERTISAIYHLLTGKRSSQTLQDAHMYQLTGYFGLIKSLQRKEFNKCMERMVKNGLISIDNDGVGFPTKKGEDYLITNNQSNILEEFKGMEYEKFAELFSLRLLLLIQTITNKKAESTGFIALTDDKQAQLWVKQLYRKYRHELDQLVTGIYHDLHAFLSKLTDQQASLFVERLTGYEKIGLSKLQLANKYKMNILDIEVWLVYIYHKILTESIHEKDKYPYLTLALEGIMDQTFVTNSATVTYNMLQNGFTIDAIARSRRLKLNTIEDHIVEIAYMDPYFTIGNFVGEAEQKEMLKAIELLQTNRLKLIKTKLNDKFSYFQIRLVLAKHRLEDKGSM